MSDSHLPVFDFRFGIYDCVACGRAWNAPPSPSAISHPMKTNRRHFLGTTAAAGALSLLPVSQTFAAENKISDAILESAAAQPVLKLPLKDPVIIESIQLLRKGRTHFVLVRSKDGAEGVSVDDGRMDLLHPILNRLVIP